MQIPAWLEQGKVCWNLYTDPHLHCDIFSARDFVLLWTTSYEYIGTVEEHSYLLCIRCFSGSISVIFLRKAYSNRKALYRNGLMKHISFFVRLYIKADVEPPNFQTCDIQLPEIYLEASFRLAFFQAGFKSMISNLNQQSSLNAYFYITTQTEKVF